MNRQCPWLVTLIAYLLLNPLLLAHAGGVFSDASDKISFGDLTDQEMSAQFAVFEGDEFPPGTSAEDSSDSEDSSAEKRATLAMFVKRDGESCQIPMGAPDVPAASGGTPDVKADEGNVDDENKDCAQACTNAFTNCKGSSMTKPKRSSSATIPCKSAEYCFCGQTPTDDIASHCQWQCQMIADGTVAFTPAGGQYTMDDAFKCLESAQSSSSTPPGCINSNSK